MHAPASFLIVVFLAVAPVRAVDRWPAEPAEEAGNLTAVEGPEPVGKNEATGTVELSWSGGVGPFTMLRAEDARLIEGRTRLADEAPVTDLADAVLYDGKTYFYMVP